MMQDMDDQQKRNRMGFRINNKFIFNCDEAEKDQSTSAISEITEEEPCV